MIPRGVALEPPAHPRGRVVVAEADGVRADVAVEPVAAEADVEVGAGVRVLAIVSGVGGSVSEPRCGPERHEGDEDILLAD